MPSLVTTGAAVLQAPVFVIAFLIVSAGVGRRILRWLSLAETTLFAERLAIAVILGAALLQIVPFTLGVVGIVTVSTLRIALGLAALVAAPDAWSTLKAARTAFQNRAPVPGWIWVWLATLLPGLLIALLLALTPTLDPDGLGYHLTVPKRWLEQGALGYLPTYPYSNTPMGVEMLFMNGMAVAGDTAAKSIHFVLGLTGACALYLAGKRLAGRPVAVLATTAFLYGPLGVGPLLGWAYLEGITSAALISSGLAWLIWYQERDRAWLRCAALLAGAGVSFKITAALFPVALGVLTLITLCSEARKERRSLLPELVSILRLLPLIILPVLPWLVRSAIVTGNPLFPMGAQWIPSRDFSAALSKKFDSYNRYMVWGINLSQEWTLARRKLFFAAITGALALCGGFIALRQRSFVARSTAWVVLGTLLIQLLAAGLYKRYWIPVLSVFQLPLLALFARQLSADWLRGPLIGLSALLSLFQARQGLKTIDNDAAGLLKTALGLEAQNAYVARHLTLFPLYELANRDLPATAGIVMSQYCGGFYLDRRTFCADITQESLRFDTREHFLTDLRKLGITHVLAPRFWAEIDSKPAMEGGNVSMLVREREHACISELMREHSHLLKAAGDQGLYAVDPAFLRGTGVDEVAAPL
jgi:hypothetical protein